MRSLLLLFALLALALAEDKKVDNGEGYQEEATPEDVPTEPPQDQPPRLRVVSIISEPFLFIRDNRYQGLVVDIVNRFSQSWGDFDLALSSDGQYGKYVNSAWDGIIGDLVNDRADIAIADLTVTLDRQTVVDFSAPFFQAPLSVVQLKTRDYNADCPSSGESGLDEILIRIAKGEPLKIAIESGLTERTLQASSYYKTQMLMDYYEKNKLDMNEAEFYPYVREKQDFHAVLINEMPTSQYFADSQPCDLQVTKLFGGSFQPREQFAFAVKKGNNMLLQKANDFVNELKTSGKLMQLEEKWFNAEC